MIWVVTDQNSIHQTLAPLITAKGYSVMNIASADEVYKRIRFQSPSLVIIDCGMPDCFEMLELIRKEIRLRPVPVIVLGADSEREKALLMGADAFVSKGSLDLAQVLFEISRLAEPQSS
jgi:two-component system KDP operon response regulator KdpE